MNIKRAVKKLFAFCGFEIRSHRHSPEMRSSVQQYVQSLHLRRSPVCLDVVANSGKTIDAFRKRMDDPKIYAFDPNVVL